MTAGGCKSQRARCLSVLLQLGSYDPQMLIEQMGKAARRLDLSPTYAQNAQHVLVAYIHRAPTQLVPFLPHCTEAIVRTLEPSDPALRRHSLLAATSALHELVKTYEVVSFHQATQRFAVGTVDGRIVIYDLRTATKWRILSGHKGSLQAVAFSDDGELLASCASFILKVWSCGSSGFFGGILGITGTCILTEAVPPGPALHIEWTGTKTLRIDRGDGESTNVHV